MLTDENKKTRKTIVFEHLHCFNLEGEWFLGKIITRNETCVHFHT